MSKSTLLTSVNNNNFDIKIYFINFIDVKYVMKLYNIPTYM